MQLIKREMVEALTKAYEHSAETGESSKRVVLKLFTPWAGATWYITEGMPLEDGAPVEYPEAIENPDDVDWHLFGFCDLGDPQNAELGYCSLAELQSLNGPAGLKVERDRTLGDETSIDDIIAKYRGKS